MTRRWYEPPNRALRFAVTLFSVLTIAGCAYEQQDALFWSKFGAPPAGMTRGDITARLGEPTRIERGEAGETLWYEDNGSGQLQQGRDYYLVLREGKVVEHGGRMTRPFTARCGELRTGMSRADVERILGKSDGVEMEGVREVLVYQGRGFYMRFSAMQPVDYHVVFEEGALVKKGNVYRRGFENPPSFVEPPFKSPGYGVAR